jgi:hypothetical protein
MSSQGVPVSSAARIVGYHSVWRAGRQASIPAVHDNLRLGARCTIGLELGRPGLES